MSHTPGPWEVHGTTVDQDFYIHGANRICDMTKPQGFYCSPKERESNARLIAAAPELLATLTELVDAVTAQRQELSIANLNRICDAEDAARAAIAKSHGQAG